MSHLEQFGHHEGAVLAGSLRGDCPLAQRVDQDVVVDGLGRRGGAKKAAVEALDAIGGVGSFKNVSIEFFENGQDEVDVAGTPHSPRRRRVLPRPLRFRRNRSLLDERLCLLDLMPQRLQSGIKANIANSSKIFGIHTWLHSLGGIGRPLGLQFGK